MGAGCPSKPEAWATSNTPSSNLMPRVSLPPAWRIDSSVSAGRARGVDERVFSGAAAGRGRPGDPSFARAGRAAVVAMPTPIAPVCFRNCRRPVILPLLSGADAFQILDAVASTPTRWQQSRLACIGDKGAAAEQYEAFSSDCPLACG